MTPQFGAACVERRDHCRVDLVALLERPVELHAADDAAQRRLRELRDRDHVVARAVRREPRIGHHNLSAFETARVGYDAVGKRLITAAQDNGVTIQSARNAPLWNAVQGADGINAFVNDVTLAATGRSVFYGNTQDLGFTSRIILDAQGNFVSPNTSGWGFGATVTCNGIACATAVAGTSFGSPWVNNRVDPTRMAFGGDGVFVTQDTLTGAQGPAANTVDLTLTDLGSTGGASVTKIAYGTRDNPNMLVAGVVGGLWQSTTATAGSLVSVPTYTAAGGGSPRQGWCSIPDRNCDIS